MEEDRRLLPCVRRTLIMADIANELLDPVLGSLLLLKGMMSDRRRILPPG
jgi:hypothetical protein